ncbi:MAG: GAF domain-containing protein [Chloroflexi bacterium]|nr:GAF domain-containing protein [Chloroflexota bacterium]
MGLTADQHVPNSGSAIPTAWLAAITWASELADTIALDQISQHIAVFVAEPEHGQLRLAAHVRGADHGPGDVVVGEWTVPMEGSVAGRVARTGAAVLCADVTLDPDYRPLPGGQTRSFLMVPVGGPEGVVAVINIEAPWTSAFSIRHLEQLTARAEAAAATFPALAA